MEISTLGPYTLSYCPACQKLFRTKRLGREGIEALASLYEEHLRDSPWCESYCAALPTLESLRGCFTEGWEWSDEKREWVSKDATD